MRCETYSGLDTIAPDPLRALQLDRLDQGEFEEADG